MSSARGNSIRIESIGEKGKQLEDRITLIAGVDPDDKAKAYILPIGPNGLKIDATINTTESGEQLPVYDSVTVDYYGSTNNIHHVFYKTGGASGSTVATRTLTYVGGGASDNDVFLSSALT